MNECQETISNFNSRIKETLENLKTLENQRDLYIKKIVKEQYGFSCGDTVENSSNEVYKITAIECQGVHSSLITVCGIRIKDSLPTIIVSFFLGEPLDPRCKLLNLS